VNDNDGFPEHWINMAFSLNLPEKRNKARYYYEKTYSTRKKGEIL